MIPAEAARLSLALSGPMITVAVLPESTKRATCSPGDRCPHCGARPNQGCRLPHVQGSTRPCAICLGEGCTICRTQKESK